MRILGIDPGFERLGIAVLEKSQGDKKELVIFSECFKTSAKLEFAERLKLIGEEVWRIIKKYQPEVLAIDFHEIRMDEKVKAHVPLLFQGEPPAVKELEGILIKNMDEIEVEALPADLPHTIAVDLSELKELDESIYVKDLPKSDKFEYVIDKETVVVSVTAPKEEEVEEVPPPAEGEEVPAGEAEAAGEVKEEESPSTHSTKAQGRPEQSRGATSSG